MLNITFGERLKELRIKEHMTQTELGEKVGKSKQWVKVRKDRGCAKVTE